MRIWILSSELASQVAGGIAQYGNNFGCLLGAAGHEVVVIARSHEPLDEEISLGFRVIGLEPRSTRLPEPNPTAEADTHPAYPYNIMADGPAFSYQMAEAVLTLLQRLPAPDIIESQDYNALPYYLIQRKLTERTPLERIPILVHLHSPDFELERINQAPRYRFPGYWVGQMVKFCMRGADALLCPSRYLARSVQELMKFPFDIPSIPLPAPPRKDSSPLAQPESGHLVCVGRLQILKGTLPLLKACHRLWSAGQDFRLTLIGGDSEIMPLATTVSDFMEKRYGRWLQSGHLQWLGQLEHAAVLEQMRQAWAVVIPSLLENFPNTCIEAMSAGQVVLGSSAGGQAEMIGEDGVNGFIFDWQEPGDFERKLGAVLNLDPVERLAMAHRAQARIRTLCDPETVLSRRVQHYQEIIDSYAPKRLFPLCHNRQDREAPLEVGPAMVPVVGGGKEQAELLSVIIPYYNLGEYFNETFQCVLASTYLPCEVVIVNDGSTDPKSLEVLQAIENRQIPNVRILHTENQGLALTRNLGGEHARGEFIAFVDADDLVEPDFFQRAIDVLRRYPNVTFVYSWLRYFGDSTGIWPTWNAEFPYLLGHNMVTVINVVRRSSFLKSAKNKKEMEYSLEDYEGWISLLEAGGVGVSLPAPLVRYRVRPNSMYQSCGPSQQLYLYDLISQNHPELYRQWGVELFNLQLANGPGYHWNHPGMHMSPYDNLMREIELLQNQLETSRNEILTMTNTLRWRIGERLIHSYPGRLALSVHLKLKNRLYT
jgi:glycogen synthase